MASIGNSFRVGIGYGANLGYTFSYHGEHKMIIERYTISESSRSSYVEQEKFKIKSALLQLSSPIQIEYALSKTKQENTLRLFYEISPSISCMINSSEHYNTLLIGNNIKQEIGLKYVFSN